MAVLAAVNEANVKSPGGEPLKRAARWKSKRNESYWAPCTTCAIATRYADEQGIELDLRDVEYEGPYNELLGLGGDANKIPYLYDDGQLVEGLDDVLEHLKALG